MDSRSLLTKAVIEREALRIAGVPIGTPIDYDFSEEELCLSLDEFSEKVLMKVLEPHLAKLKTTS